MQLQSSVLSQNHLNDVRDHAPEFIAYLQRINHPLAPILAISTSADCIVASAHHLAETDIIHTECDAVLFINRVALEILGIA
jgi:hypothetical protein